ncbi:MAG: ABC transporter permease [Chloroflexota bacterium]|nr:ABC transporter permease [Chloroflexota bacterium]
MRTDLGRIWGLAVKELLQLARDRLLLAFLILAPLLELLLMGGLSGGGVHNLPLAIVDHDRSRASRDLAARLGRTDELLLTAQAANLEEARGWMQNGQMAVIAVIPPGYSAALTDPGQSASVQVIADGSNYVVSTVALATAEDVAAEISRNISAVGPKMTGGPVDLRFMARFNAALRDQPHAITLMLAMIVFEVALVVAAQSFARERELGTMEQLRVTPLRRIDLMLGKAIPTLLIGMVDFLMMLGLAIVWFDIPLRGSLPLLCVLTIPFLLAQIGWGTLISLVSRTQQQAMLLVFALAMLEVAFSGLLVPASAMPGFMRTVSYVSSVQHYLVILRGVMLRGAGLSLIWLPALALAGIASVTMAAAWLRLQAGLDADSLRRRAGGVWVRARHWWCNQRPSLCPGQRRRRKPKREWSTDPA